MLEKTIAAMPGLSMTHIEATYLAWIDARELDVDDPFELFLSHGVALSDGSQFGGPGYVRLNFGCPRSTLEQILQRMQNAIDVTVN